MTTGRRSPRNAARRPGGRADEPVIVLSEAAGVRYLHFDSPWIQGAMRIARPFDLELDYAHDMMAWRLFLAAPDEMLQMGLGAAGLARHCWKKLPKTRITVVEASRAVIDVCRSTFALPEDERLEVVRADAGEYVSRRSSRGRFGVILADLYDTKARGPVLDDVPFYRDCRAALAPAGILVVNVFGDGRSYANSLRNVRMAFDDRVIALPPVAAGNVALLAFSGPELRIEWEALRERARRLGKKDRLPAEQWVQEIRRQRGGGTVLAV